MLNGIFAHWLDDAGKKQKLLLSLPSIDESHSGTNIADGVTAIIKQFGLHERIGYFVLDNASNCDTAIECLAEIFNFKTKEHRLWCAAHIFNLVAQQIMYGTNLSAFEEDGEDPVQLEVKLECWRCKGALGKLCNIIYWITDKHVDGSRSWQFKKIQSEQ